MTARSPARACWKPECWPALDQAAWAAINTRSHFLKAASVGAAWRPATRFKHQSAWGRFLCFLDDTGQLHVGEPTGNRVTPERVASFIERLESEVSSRTQFGYVVSLLVLGRLFAPNRDWDWLVSIVNVLQFEAKPIHNPELRSSIELFDAGLGLISRAGKMKPRLALDQSTWFRDGLMIALLASRPIRFANLCMIRIGTHLTRRGDRYWLAFSGDEMKNHRPLEFPLPERLTAPMERYLNDHRRLLLQGSKSDMLWISNLGRAMHPGSIYDRIKDTTKRLVGVAISPHAFRHCAATTIAEYDPANAHIIRAILSHSSLAFSNRVYNRAANVTAATKHADHVTRLRGRLTIPME